MKKTVRSRFFFTVNENTNFLPPIYPKIGGFLLSKCKKKPFYSKKSNLDGKRFYDFNG